MDGQIIANAYHHEYWGFPIALYFWLVGGSAGSFVISSLGWVFGIKKYKPIAFFASNFATFLLLLVPILLIIDLGKPYRFFHILMVTSFSHWSAPMVWGSFFILSYPVGMMIYSYFVYKKDPKWARIFGILAVVLAICTHWYTGVVMQLNPSRIPNHDSAAPILFLTGAYVSGIGLLIVCMWLRNKFTRREIVPEELLISMSRLMLYGIVFDMFLLLNDFLQATYGTGEDHTMLYDVLLGVFRWPYLYLELVWGLWIPLVLLILSKTRENIYWVVAASFMCATGIYGMRIWWVMGTTYYQGHF